MVVWLLVCPDEPCVVVVDRVAQPPDALGAVVPVGWLEPLGPVVVVDVPGAGGGGGFASAVVVVVLSSQLAEELAEV